MIDFIEDFNVDLVVLSCIESIIKYIPQTFWGQAQLTIMLDCLGSRKFLPIDPISKFPRAFSFVGNFLDFIIEI